MKKVFFVLFVAVLLFSGCAVGTYTKTSPDGREAVKMSGFFSTLPLIGGEGYSYPGATYYTTPVYVPAYRYYRPAPRYWRRR